jgi:hypothetical protein
MYDESVRWSDDGATVGHEDLDLKAIEPPKMRGDLQVDWQAGGVATTPPGMWHAHFNETDQPPHLIPRAGRGAANLSAHQVGEGLEASPELDAAVGRTFCEPGWGARYYPLDSDAQGPLLTVPSLP